MMLLQLSEQQRRPKIEDHQLHIDKKETKMTTPKPGLYADIKAKKGRIAHGGNEPMRKASDPAAPTAQDFEKAKAAPKA